MPGLLPDGAWLEASVIEEVIMLTHSGLAAAGLPTTGRGPRLVGRGRADHSPLGAPEAAEAREKERSAG